MKKNLISNIILLFCTVAFVVAFAMRSVFECIEGFEPAYFSGSLTQGHPINILFFTGNIGLAALYMKLYSLVPHIPWYELFLFSYVALSLFVILRALADRYGHMSAGVLIVVLGLCLLLATNYMRVFQYTRIAFALGTASLILLIISSDEKQTAKKVLSGFLFLMCLLTRPETGVVVIIIQWLAFFFITNRKASKAVLCLNTLSAVLIMGYISYDRLTTDSFVKQMEPELSYQLLDRGNIVPLSAMTNAVDTARYMAVIHMISDPQYMSISFLRSLVKENAFVGISMPLIARSQEILIESVKQSWGLFVIYLSLLLYTLRQQITARRPSAIRLLIFNLCFWALVIVTVYTIKMEIWVFSSLLVMMCLVLLFSIEPSSIGINIRSLMTTTLILYGAISMIRSDTEYKRQIERDTALNQTLYNEFKKRYSGKILLPSQINALQIINSRKPLELADFSSFHRVYLLDCDVLYLEENYNAYLKNDCHCDAGSYTNIMDYITSKGDSVRVIADPVRIAQIKSYCQIVRHKTYDFIPIDSIHIGKETRWVYTFR